MTKKRKYEFTGDTCNYFNITLHRIKRLSDGELGGWIEKEENLSHYDNAWVYEDAKVFGNAEVFGNARVYGNAMIHGNAMIYEDAKVFGIAEVFGNARVYGNAMIYGNAKVAEHMRIISGECVKDLKKNIKESIRCQTGLGVFSDRVYAYKQVRKDMRSFHDDEFIYEVGKVAVAELVDDNPEISCAGGLHFSNMHYWNTEQSAEESIFLLAEINIKDIVSVQKGKIRCRKAMILGTYEVSDEEIRCE